LSANQYHISRFKLRFLFDFYKSAIAARFIYQDKVRTAFDYARVIAGHQVIVWESDTSLGATYPDFVSDFIRRSNSPALHQEAQKRLDWMSD
jgi:hypothetical protein